MDSILELGLLAFGLYLVWQAQSPTIESDPYFGVNMAMDTTPPEAQSPIVIGLARGIAKAEGFFVPGSRPARDHNPGDMTMDLIGKSIGRDGSFAVFSNDGDGWANLYAQIELWLSGRSAHANADSTITDISQFYTDTQQQEWAANVAASLGVSPDTPIGQLA